MRRRTFTRQRSTHCHLNPQHRYALFDLGWNHAGLTFNAMRVYLVLAAHANADDGICWPSIELIMQESGIRDRSAVFKALRQLEEERAITRQRRRGTSNRYFVHPAPFAPSVAVCAVVKSTSSTVVDFTTGSTHVKRPLSYSIEGGNSSSSVLSSSSS